MASTTRPQSFLRAKHQHKPVVYVVAADPELLARLERILSAPEHETRAFADPADFLAIVDPAQPACVVIDADLPGSPDGLGLVEQLRLEAPELVVVVMTAAGDVPAAVRALRAGAADLFERPLVEAVVRHRVLEALDAIG